MTLTLELPLELENALAEKAARRGVALDALVLDAVAEYAAREESGVEHRARVAAGYGKFAGVSGTVDDFLREKHEEVAREIELEERDHVRQQQDAP